MDTTVDVTPISSDIQCIEITPTRHVPDLEEDARAGLADRPRSLPPKYFYDESISMMKEARHYSTGSVILPNITSPALKTPYYSNTAPILLRKPAPII